VLLRNVTATQAAAIGADLVGRVAARAVHGTGVDARRSTASVGVVVFESGTEMTGAELLNDADLAMYEAKENGGNRCVVYSPQPPEGDHAASGPISWPDRIRRALDEDRLMLYAQPILEIKRAEISRYELLLRMLGPEGELILPDAFLPVAERRGIIRTIDRWVVREAIALLRHAQPGVRLQVNISGRSLSDSDFLGFIRNELARSGAAPENLVFEVTETAAIANLDDAHSFLTSLAELGCGIALDDFGSGFASFQYLKTLPFDEMKIDGQFIQNVKTNPDDLLLVETLVRLAHGLGKRTVAEYVEDVATLQLIGDLGVDYAQGFFVGVPVPARPLIMRSGASPATARSELHRRTSARPPRRGTTRSR
jgi:EAL domain-containing protein (putative c-di-GMP-specific phosphodiesterase class I)